MLLVFLTMMSSSCTLFDNDSFEPAFLEIDSVSLATTLPQGAPTHRIEDVWVFVDGFVVGVFTLPARIPVIPTKDTTDIRITAGVRQNGMRDVPIEYPFYDAIQLRLPIKSGETRRLTPQFQYRPDSKFDFVEGFELGNIFTSDEDGNPETTMVITTAEAATGARSGLMLSSASRPRTEVATFSEFLGENNARGAVYLEIEYKSEAEVFVGVIVRTAVEEIKNYKLILRRNTNWTKVYVDLTDEISNAAVVTYKVVVGTEYPSNAPGTSTNTFIDNVKLIHF